MSYRIQLLPEARQDIREAIAYYNEQKDQLGLEFFANLAQAVQLVSTNPKIYRIRHKKVRQAPIKKFSVQLHYLIEERKKRVVVIAVLHTSRNPQIWKDRS